MKPSSLWRYGWAALAAMMFSTSVSAADFLGSWALYQNPNFLNGISVTGFTALRARVAFGPEADIDEGADLFENLSFGQGDDGEKFFADSTNDSDFSYIANLLTNGIDNDSVLAQFNQLPQGGGYGAHWTESFWANRPASSAPADFQGYRIDRIELVAEIVDWTSPGTNPNGDGNWTDYTFDTRLDFYGTLVPEPSAIALLTASALVMLLRPTNRAYRNR